MKQEQQENIIRDLLYEVSARDHLTSRSKPVKKSLPSYWIAIAASLLLFVVYLGMKDSSSSFDQRKEWIADNYQFPEVHKSRSADQNVVDKYIADLKQGKYDQVLDKMNLDTLSEKDLFIKAHLYFSLDQVDQTIEIVRNNEWSDDYREDILWLDFIIQYKNGADKNTLKKLASELSLTNKTKASDLLNR